MNMDGQILSISNQHQNIQKMSVLLRLPIKELKNMVKTHHITSKKKLKKTDQNSQFILEIWDTLRAKAKLHISSTIKYIFTLWHTKCHSCGLSCFDPPKNTLITAKLKHLMTQSAQNSKNTRLM